MMTPQRASAPNWRWEPVEHHATIGSTHALVLADPRVGRVVVADHQSAGLGRRGRTWSSPPGTGMAISAVLPAPAPEVLGWVPLATGLAVHQALLGSRWSLRTALKWPNDVLVAGPPRPGKLAGVLAQVADGMVVVGVGVNVDHDVDQLPVATATSWRLSRGGAPLPEQAREVFLDDLLSHLARWHDDLVQGDLEGVRAAYRKASATLGSQVVVHLPGGGRAAGRALDLAPDGALVVQGQGVRTVHHAGDVEHLRPQEAPE